MWSEASPVELSSPEMQTHSSFVKERMVHSVRESAAMKLGDNLWLPAAKVFKLRWGQIKGETGPQIIEIDKLELHPGGLGTLLGATLLSCLGGGHVRLHSSPSFAEVARILVKPDAYNTTIGLQHHVCNPYLACQWDLAAAARIANGDPVVTAIARWLLSRTGRWVIKLK